MSANTQDNAPVSAEPVAQYYYKVTGCPAVEASDEKCICWHDKGTGPHPDAQVGDIHSGVTLTWRRPKPTAPVAAQPDLTQQTLDDVKAGIPARDAEIDSLRKEIETLRDANKADAGQNYNDGFSDGVILALQLMSMHGDYGGTQYCELLSAAGPNQIVERAISERMWEMSGLSQTPTAVERRAAIDAARKEQA